MKRVTLYFNNLDALQSFVFVEKPSVLLVRAKDLSLLADLNDDQIFTAGAVYNAVPRFATPDFQSSYFLGSIEYEIAAYNRLWRTLLR